MLCRELLAVAVGVLDLVALAKAWPPPPRSSSRLCDQLVISLCRFPPKYSKSTSMKREFHRNSHKNSAELHDFAGAFLIS